jgi:hydroxymethylglutaryl-CoA reductase
VAEQSSRLSGFYRLSVTERQNAIGEHARLRRAQIEELARGGLTLELADCLIENVVGVFGLPFGIAANFYVNNRDYLIPMVIEEPSVVAAASHAAKLVRASGGFSARADESRMIGQIQLLDVSDLADAREKILSAKNELLAEANAVDAVIVALGGGAIDLETRIFADSRVGPMLVVHILFDTRDAMGGNAVNTVCERLAPHLEQISGGRANLRILSNLADRRLARAACRVPGDVIGAEVVRGIVEAQVLAEIDPYRAATHNKGVLNGIDAVAVATGNDWRAIEAGAHAYAARSGQYRALTNWTRDEDGDLRGEIELPLAIGLVGGMTRAHPVAQIALQILGVQSARELAAVMAAVGLAQNLGALRALAAEGIQAGHMKLHARRSKSE